ncbi:sugar ABC transporter permease [Patescibacteria group bacterium]|nr:sugar ABC transporter permease [Patescibacteria group bacterium]
MSRMKKLTPYLFLLPPLLLYIIWIIGPTIYSFYLSFTNWNGISLDMDFIGLKNYKKLFVDPVFHICLVNNLKWIGIFLTLPVIIGLVLAIFLNSNIKRSQIFKTIFYLPMAISLVAINLMWSWIYNPAYGILNVTLRNIGLGFLAQGWLSNPDLVLYSIIVAASWPQTGYILILFTAGLNNIPPNLIDAAKVDGASFWEIFKNIILPLLKPTTVIVIIVTVIGSLRVFDIVYTMTRGGPFNSSNVLANFMYIESFSNYRMGYGAAIAVILFLISFIFIIIYLRRFLKTEIEY